MKLKKTGMLTAGMLLIIFCLVVFSGVAPAEWTGPAAVRAASLCAPDAAVFAVAAEPALPERPAVQFGGTEPDSGESGASQAPDPYFTAAGVEEVSSDAKRGNWLYRSSTLYVKVERIFNKKKVQTYFVADIRFKPPERERPGFSKPKNPGRTGLKLYQIARNYGAVIAVNGDYMHRVEKSRKGIIIRNGKVYSERKGADTLAFYPDGTMRIVKPGETTAKKLLKEGVKNTYSFGPTLMKNGMIMKNLHKHRIQRRNPRSAVGMVEPYHYIFVVVDGRRARYSKGMSLNELASVFKAYECTVAYNLDGGASAAMSFMGNNISKYNGSYTGQRRVPDALMFGKSDKVPKK